MMNEEKDRQWLLNEKYGGVETAQYAKDCQRLKEGEPLAYVIGWVDFLQCKIDLSFRPLIPRTETEWWAEKVIKAHKERPQSPLHALDLCAGSGCIGVAVAYHLPQAHVDFIDIDPSACEQISLNLSLNKISPERVRIFRTDLFENLEGQYDLIFANPPYIDPLMGNVDEAVETYEPPVALFSKNGTTTIFRIIDDAHQYLSSAGELYIEFGEEQWESIYGYAITHGYNAELIKDQYDRDRVAHLTKK